MNPTNPEVPRKVLRGLTLLNAGVAAFFIFVGGGVSGGVLILTGMGAAVIGLTTGIIVTVRNRTWRLVPGIVGCVLFIGWWGLALAAEAADR